MLQPKRTKFRKQFKGRIKGVAKGGFDLAFGEFGLKAQEPNRVNAREIEAARRAITRYMKRAGRVWIRVFPDVPVRQSRPKCAWVRVRVLSNTGLARSSLVVSCSRSTAFRKRSRARHFASGLPSSRSRRASYSASQIKEKAR